MEERGAVGAPNGDPPPGGSVENLGSPPDGGILVRLEHSAMLSQVKVLLHFSALLLTAVAVLAVPRPGAAAGLGRIGADQASPSQDAPPPSTLTVFIQGNPIGSEEVTVASDAEGWTIRATGRLGVPVNLSTVRFEVRYDRNWQPVSLVVESSLRGQPLLLNTTFSGGAAASSITQAGQQTQKTDQVAADTVVLPNMFFAAYEALALRLPSVSPGTELRVHRAAGGDPGQGRRVHAGTDQDRQPHDHGTTLRPHHHESGRCAPGRAVGRRGEPPHPLPTADPVARGRARGRGNGVRADRTAGEGGR